MYTSQAVVPFKKDDSEQLLLKSRANNKKVGITGLLLHHPNGTFIQLIEGEEQPLLKLFERIKTDKRHSALGVLFDHITESRAFPEWSMGFGVLTQCQLEQFTQTKQISTANTTASDVAASLPVISAMRAIYKANA